MQKRQQSRRNSLAKILAPQGMYLGSSQVRGSTALFRSILQRKILKYSILLEVFPGKRLDPVSDVIG